MLLMRGCGPVAGQSMGPQSSAHGVLLSRLASPRVLSSGCLAPVERLAHGPSGAQRVNAGRKPMVITAVTSIGATASPLQNHGHISAAAGGDVVQIGRVVSGRFLGVR